MLRYSSCKWWVPFKKDQYEGKSACLTAMCLGRWELKCLDHRIEDNISALTVNMSTSTLKQK